MKSSFVKDLFSVLSSKMAVIIFNLGANVIIARCLGPQANGVIAALMVYPLLFMTIGSLGIQQATAYFVGQEKYNIREIYGSVLVIWMFTSIFCLFSCYFLIKYFTSGNYSNALIILSVIAIPFSLYNTYSSGIFLGQRDFKEYNRINWLPAAFTFFFTFLLVVVFRFSIGGYMVASFLGAFILSLFVVAKMQRMVGIKPRLVSKIIKQMLSLGIIYAVSLLVSFLHYRIDVIMLEKISTSYEVGIYSKGAVLVEYLWQIPVLLSTLIFSRSATAKDSTEFSLKTCRLLRFAFFTILIASVLLYILSDFIINILYGSMFAGSAQILKILTPGVLLLTIFKVLGNDMAGQGKPWVSMKAMGPSVIINVVLNYLWIPKYGASGSALASTVSYSIAAIIFLHVYSKESNITISKILRFTEEDINLIKRTYRTVKYKLMVRK
jgi:O-antigen/teichoic acid export membrane protein